MKNLRLWVLMLVLQFAASHAHADWFQLERAEAGAYISHARVEVLGQDRTVGYTDYFGRVELRLPNGRYTGFVSQGDWRGRFDFQVDGRNVIKVYRVE